MLPVHGAEFTGTNVGFDSLEKPLSATARGEIPLHLPVPLIHLPLCDPGCEGRPVLRRKIGDRFLDGIQRQSYPLWTDPASR